MANDPSLPSLALSDIMYNMSPSPGTRQSPEEPSTVQEREVSPEPVSAEDIERMRQKVQETVLKFGFNGQFSSMERELMEMVLRLTSSSFIDPSQLIRQGEIISGLTSQRDYLVRQAEEARQRFESEKDGWTRMAEALIAQRHKHGNSGMREQELERQCSTMQSDNRNLRAKLLDTQNRLSSLETELKNLKPLLLLNPGPSSGRSDTAPSNPSPSKGKGKQGQRNMSVDISIAEDGRFLTRQSSQGHAQSHPSSQEHHSPGPFSSASGAPVPRTIHSSRHVHSGTSPISGPSSVPGSSSTKKPKSSKSSRKAAAGSIIPLSSDAKTEHILLAARRIGRERVAAVAGVMRAAEQEKERILREQESTRIAKETERLERERLERLASGSAGMGYYRRETVEMANSNASSTSGQSHRQAGPGTPQRAGMGFYPHPSAPPANVPPAGASFVFVGNPGGPLSYAGPGVTRTPTPVNNATNTHEHGHLQFEPAHHQQQRQDSQNSPTPLASLLSAASMLDDGSNMSSNACASTPPPSSSSRGRRKSNAVEQNDTPLPKRRRVAPSSNVKGIGRVRSALDVLADQAAAAFTNEADQADSAEPSSSVSTKKNPTLTTARAKGKGKAKESDLGNSRKAATMAPPVATQQEASVSATPSNGRTTRSAKVKARATLASALAPTPSVTRKPRVRPPPRDRSTILAASIKNMENNEASSPFPASGAAPRMISPPGGRANVPATSSSSTGISPPAQLSGIVDTLLPVIIQSSEVNTDHPLDTGDDVVPLPAVFFNPHKDCGEVGDDVNGDSSAVPIEDAFPNQVDGTRMYTLPETHPLSNNSSPLTILPIVDPSPSISHFILNNTLRALEDTSQIIKSNSFESDLIFRPDSSITENTTASSPLPGVALLPGADEFDNFAAAMEETYSGDSSAIAVDEHAPVPKIYDTNVHDIDAEADMDEDAEGENDDEIRNEGEKEEDVKDELEVENHDRQPPSHTQVPVPLCGNGGSGQPDTDDHDTDADAEGEDDNEAEESSHTVGSGVTEHALLEGQAISLGFAQDLKAVISFSASCP